MRCGAGDRAHKALTARGVRSPDQRVQKKISESLSDQGGYG